MMRFAAIVAGLVFALLAAAPASANTIKTYELDGVTFSDGGTATGSFSLDLTTNTLVSSSIVTSFKNIVFVGGDYNGSLFDSFTATPAASVKFAAWGIFFVSGQLLTLNFSPSDLSMASFVASGSEKVYSVLCFRNGFLCGTRTIVAGTINAVATTPIPAALLLFTSALGGLGFFGWRGRKSAPAAA